jgi:hypothetical protein
MHNSARRSTLVSEHRNIRNGSRGQRNHEPAKPLEAYSDLACGRKHPIATERPTTPDHTWPPSQSKTQKLRPTKTKTKTASFELRPPSGCRNNYDVILNCGSGRPENLSLNSSVQKRPADSTAGNPIQHFRLVQT